MRFRQSALLAGALSCALIGALAGAAPATAAGGPGEVIGGPQLASPGVVWSRPAGVPAPPVVPASSWLLADVDTGDVLAAKAAHVRLRPASTQKVLTALTLLPRLDPAAVYTARYEDAAVDGSKAGMVPGAPYTVRQLWQALFLVSGNDAATGLANAAGGIGPTLTAMRERAHDLQAADTSVVNVTGLDAPGQLSSAYDLALIARAALGRPDFRAYCVTIKAQFPGKHVPGHQRGTFQIFTQDKLVLNYPGGIGVKTGFTTLARSTFVGAATRGGHTLVVTLMHTDARSWREAAALLDWGFAHEGTLSPVGALVAPLSAQPAPAAAPEAVARPSVARLQHAGLTVGSPPWWAWLLLAAVAAVVSLRTRVLVRRSRSRRRRVADAGLLRLGRPD